MMFVVFNGKTYPVKVDATLNDLMKTMNTDPCYTVIAINNTFIPKEKYGTTELQPGDRIEYVTPMQGG